MTTKDRIAELEAALRHAEEQVIQWAQEARYWRSKQEARPIATAMAEPVTKRLSDTRIFRGMKS